MIKDISITVLVCVCVIMASYGMGRFFNFVPSDAFNFFLLFGIGFGIIIGIMTNRSMAHDPLNQKEEISKDDLLDKF